MTNIQHHYVPPAPPARLHGESQVAHAHRVSAYFKGVATGGRPGDPAVEEVPTRTLSRADLSRVQQVRADMSDMADRGVQGLINGTWVRLPDTLVPHAWKSVGATPRTPAELAGSGRAGGSSFSAADALDDDLLADLMAEHYGPPQTSAGADDPDEQLADLMDHVYGSSSTTHGAHSDAVPSPSETVDDEQLAQLMDEVYGATSR